MSENERVPVESTIDLGGEALELLQSIRRIMFFWGVVLPIISAIYVIMEAGS